MGEQRTTTTHKQLQDLRALIQSPIFSTNRPQSSLSSHQSRPGHASLSMSRSSKFRSRPQTSMGFIQEQHHDAQAPGGAIGRSVSFGARSTSPMGGDDRRQKDVRGLSGSGLESQSASFVRRTPAGRPDDSTLNGGPNTELLKFAADAKMSAHTTSLIRDARDKVLAQALRFCAYASLWPCMYLSAHRYFRPTG